MPLDFAGLGLSLTTCADSAPLTLKEFARWLIACEDDLGQRAGATNSTAFRICEKMRGPLGKLLGVRGFDSLLSRALALAGAQVSWMRELKLQADGSLAGLAEVETQLEARAIAAGELILVSHLLGLLETFIGRCTTAGRMKMVPLPALSFWPSSAPPS